jgi:hypothetical protein
VILNSKVKILIIQVVLFVLVLLFRIGFVVVQRESAIGGDWSNDINFHVFSVMASIAYGSTGGKKGSNGFCSYDLFIHSHYFSVGAPGLKDQGYDVVAGMIIF